MLIWFVIVGSLALWAIVATVGEVRRDGYGRRRMVEQPRGWDQFDAD